MDKQVDKRLFLLDDYYFLAKINAIPSTGCPQGCSCHGSTAYTNRSTNPHHTDKGLPDDKSLCEVLFLAGSIL